MFPPTEGKTIAEEPSEKAANLQPLPTLGYAEPNSLSRLIPTNKSGELTVVLTKKNNRPVENLTDKNEKGREVNQYTRGNTF